MTTSGPDRIIACPNCGHLAKHFTLLSGNTCSRRVWTDGKQELLMLPSPPAVVQCPQCRKCYWLAEAEEMGEDSGQNNDGAVTNPPNWQNVPSVEEPVEEAFYRAIDSGCMGTNDEHETHARLLAWYKSNDAYREANPEIGSPGPPISEQRRSNMERLGLLLAAGAGDNDDVEWPALIRAELSRELGDFDAARVWLGKVTSVEHDEFRQKLTYLCDRRDVHLRFLSGKPTSTTSDAWCCCVLPAAMAIVVIGSIFLLLRWLVWQ